MEIVMMLKSEKQKGHSSCCNDMDKALKELEAPLYYSSAYDEYGIRTSSQYEYYIINYCPWCKSALPKSKRDLWFESLELKGIDPWENTIPVEYLSSEWRKNA